MILISAREGFWSDNKLAVDDAIRDVDLVGEDDSTVVDEATFLSSIGVIHLPRRKY